MTKTKKKHVSEYDRFMALSDAEKAAEVAKYEQSDDRSEFKPLTPAQRKHWDRIQAGLLRRPNRPRGPGRPTVGKGATQIGVTIERGLLHRVDRFAKQHGVKRAELIARGLELAMKEKEAA